MEEIILGILKNSISVKEHAVHGNLNALIKAADQIAACIASGHKLLIFGNGGSAADAQHMAAEFVNRFKVERSPLAALSLTTDTSVITSIANDYHFNEIFSKQVKALGKMDDIALGISTSGNSKNVIEAIHTAKKMGLFTFAFTGRGGELAAIADLVFTVDSDDTARIQETHILFAHILSDLVEKMLFPKLFTFNSEKKDVSHV